MQNDVSTKWCFYILPFLVKHFCLKRSKCMLLGVSFVIVAPANVRNQLPRYCQVRKMAIFTNLGVKPRLYRVLVFDYVTLQRSSASHVPLRDERNMRWDSAYVCWSSYTGPYFGLYKHFFTQTCEETLGDDLIMIRSITSLFFDFFSRFWSATSVLLKLH